MSFAHVQVLGNLGGDPETRYTPNGQMTVQFSIAVNDYKKPNDPPVWYRVNAWDRQAEVLDKLTQNGKLQKGYSLMVSGRLSPREWTDNSGKVRTSMDVNLTSFEFVGGGRPDTNGTEESAQTSGNAVAAAASNVRNVSDVPF